MLLLPIVTIAVSMTYLIRYTQEIFSEETKPAFPDICTFLVYLKNRQNMPVIIGA